jgi:hypothetical protein
MAGRFGVVVAVACFGALLFSDFFVRFLLTQFVVRRGLVWLLAREMGRGGAWAVSGATFSFVLRSEVVWGVCGASGSIAGDENLGCRVRV